MPALRVPASTVLAAALLTVLACGCADPASPAPAPSATAHVSGQSAPDVTGVVAVRGGGPVLTQASDGYFEGMSLGAGDPSVISDAGQLALDDLGDGDAVEVWLAEGGSCAESAPVQCQVLTIRVDS